jgi:hypothetical protein
MDSHPGNETSYTTQYQEAFLMDVENEYCAKHRRVPVNQLESVPCSNFILSVTASGSYQSSFNADDSSGDDMEYLTTNIVAETTSG